MSESTNGPSEVCDLGNKVVDRQQKKQAYLQKMTLQSGSFMSIRHEERGQVAKTDKVYGICEHVLKLRIC